MALSEFTRDELTETLGVPGDRIRVIGNGVDAVFTPSGPAAAGDYVLAVGTLEPRKNLARVVEAARLAGIELRVVGAIGWGGVEVPGWVGRVDDEALAELYRGARCLVFPSLYEGFGIPILEAMACGTPVVTSRGGATEETAGGAAVLVDPLDVEAIAAAIGEAQRPLGRAAPLSVSSAPARSRGNVPPTSSSNSGESSRERTRSSSSTRTFSAGGARETRRTSATCCASWRRSRSRRACDSRRSHVGPISFLQASRRSSCPGAGRSCGWAGPCRACFVVSTRPLVHTQYAVPLRCPCPAVVMIHDLSFERDPSVMKRHDRVVFRWAVPRAARSAVRVLTVSDRSKRDIVELYGIDPEKVVVTPNGVDPIFAPGPGGARDYVLSVGAVQPRKNQLAALLAAQEVGLPLVVVGPEKDPATARELRARGATLRGYVTLEELRCALRRGCLRRAVVPLRGIRPPGSRGNGLWRAGRHRARSGAPRGGRRCGSRGG